MSIYSEPFPKRGTHYVPTKLEATTIIFCARCKDGKESIRELERFLDWDGVMPEIKTDVTVSQIRKPIKLLWDKMSKKAKALYFAYQYNQGVEYLADIMDNIREEFGNDFEKPSFPTTDKLIGEWLKQEHHDKI